MVEGKHFKEGHSRQRKQTLNKGAKLWKSVTVKYEDQGKILKMNSQEMGQKVAQEPLQDCRVDHSTVCLVDHGRGLYLKASTLLLEALS